MEKNPFEHWENHCLQCLYHCCCYEWIKIEFIALLMANIILLLLIIFDFDGNKRNSDWYYILSLFYLIISDISFLWMRLKFLIWSAPRVCFWNQVISLILNAVIPSVLLKYGFNQIWSPIIVLIIVTEIAIMECIGLCFIDICTSFRISGMYRLSVWRYYFEHIPYDIGYISRTPPSKKDTRYIEIALTAYDNNVSVPLVVGSPK